MKSALSASALAFSTLVAALISAGGCVKGNEPPPVQRTEDVPLTPAAEASSPALIGVWTVVAHHIPAISALSDADATAWHGRTVRLIGNEAMAGGSHCGEPTYGSRTVAKDAFLAAEFNLPPGRLKPLASLEQITLLEVSCGGRPWAAPGGRLIEIDEGRALAPWDGVFFELRRDRDFRAAGQEPFWRLEVAKGKEIRFTQPGQTDVVTPAPEPVINPESGARVYHAITEATDLRVIIEPRSCTDVMSGKPFETTVTVTLKGQRYHGCGGAPE